jgi:tripartite-type tricarboxylate transporter receptor subunit TctC
MRKLQMMRGLSVLAVLAFCPAAGFADDSVADFYRGKQVRIVVGNPPGGSYDTYARLVAAHIERHLPGNPKLVVQNMPGAGSRLATNWLYNVAPRDGTVLGLVGQGTPTDEALNEQGVQFESGKFNWIGNPIVDNNASGVWAATGLKTIEDIKTKGGMICAGSGATSSSVTYPQALNNLIGTKIAIVYGYPGSPEMDFAIERGEVNCRAGSSWAGWRAEKPDWLRDHKLNIFVQWGPKKNPEISRYMGMEVPLVSEFAKTDLDRQALDVITSGVALGRPLLAPPGVPADRVEALRAAFMETVKDPAFLAEATTRNADVNPIGGADLQRLASEVARAPADVMKRVNELINPKDAKELRN